ncbi:MAG: methyltransferase domain-containing protein [Nostoc sp.]|uniref:methyltransferase domain-containing protein n=1 Tax=Nostoc sp. TaxID=1180 RepID=UPI002FFD279F
MIEIASLNNFQKFLVCPKCKNKLEFGKNFIICTSCNSKFPQLADDWLNLMPDQLLENEATKWEERLLEMEDWYKHLMTNSTSAINCFAADYTPFVPFLAGLSGNILDVGGGIGVPRNYLNSNNNYIVIDPSIEWLRIDWSSLLDRFPYLESKPNFVRGIGECLPFPSESFDAVLSFWSLNHASDPKLVMSEVARVLRPGGRVLLVLEEMIPQWFDIGNPKFLAKSVFNSFFNTISSRKPLPRLRLLLKLLKREDWPLQTDHVRILESEIKEWTGQNFEIIQRVWINQYLTFELNKI